jgi:hypothetical protein
MLTVLASGNDLYVSQGSAQPTRWQAGSPATWMEPGHRVRRAD